MAIVKQSSGHKRQWFDRLAQLVCITAILTLIAAGIAGILGRRLNTLLATQQASVKAEQRQQDKTLTASLEAAKSKWHQKQAGLEKALQSANLKIKAEQSANAKIRKQLVVLQKELAALKKSGKDRFAEAKAPDEKAPVTAATAAKPLPSSDKPQAAAQQAESPAAAEPPFPGPLPGSAEPAAKPSAAATPASANGTTAVATAKSVSKQNAAAVTPPKSSLLAVPDADPVASE
ncbi:MAG: hypothetical protein P8010_18175 [Desulfosarcinaceae bacterium]|jgi:hypothetical protein